MFGISSNTPEIKNETSLLVRKPYLGTIYIESNIEEDIDMKISIQLEIQKILLALEKQIQEVLLILFLTMLV